MKHGGNIMSLKNGMSALNLEMSDYVPRTEYSAEYNCDLVRKVTGIDVKPTDSFEIRDKAAGEFIRKWDYGMNWNVKLHSDVFGKYRASMGHANYASEGVDKNSEIFCAFEDEEEVLKFDPFETFGEIDVAHWKNNFELDYNKMTGICEDTVNMTGTYITCMSGLIELFGWDLLLCAAGSDIEKFGDLTNRYSIWMQQYFEAIAQTDIKVIMVHDDICWTDGPFLNPEWYRKYIFPNYKRMFAPLLEKNKKILFTSDGNYTCFIDDIAKTGVHGFVLEPTTDMSYIADKYGKTHVFVGNADTRILLNGNKEDIYNEVKRCMDIGKKHPGFFMAVGNHIPSNTPIDNALYYNEYYKLLSKR